MKTEWQANLAQAEFYEAHRWVGTLGPKREAAPRVAPLTILQRLVAWVAA